MPKTFDIEHALEVAAHFEEGTREREVALLHDVLEDTDLTYFDLIRLKVHPDTAHMVYILTRHPKDTYVEYIEIIAYSYPIAKKVKIADLKVNLARMDELHKTLEPRYERALERLDG